MSSRRTLRVSGVLQAEISRLLTQQRLFEGTIITVTAVDVTSDLRQAFVYVSFLENTQSAERILHTLAKQAFDFQKEIAKRTGLKNTPKLTFRYDENLERGDKVLDLLQRVAEEDKQRQAGS
jgi:ribosome-binding factor A